MTNPKPKKKNGKLQRADVALTRGMASALAQLILDGKSLYPESKRLSLTYKNEQGKEVTEILSSHTLKGWVERGNVIPGSGQLLREFLDEKRILKRRQEREAMQQSIIDESERQLREISKISLLPRPDIERRYKVTTRGLKLTSETHMEHGTSPKMVEAVVRALSFGLERLDPDRYSSKTETKNSHFVFSLADLQRIKEERNAKQVQPHDI